jgi:hypothetical protein
MYQNTGHCLVLVCNVTTFFVTSFAPQRVLDAADLHPLGHLLPHDPLLLCLLGKQRRPPPAPVAPTLVVPYLWLLMVSTLASMQGHCLTLL